MEDSVLNDQPGLIHLISLVAVIFAGFYTAAHMPLNDIRDLANSIIESSSINLEDLLPAFEHIRFLPVAMQMFVILLIVKGIFYLKAAPILLFGYIAGSVDAKIKLCEPGIISTHSSHSVTAYHAAKKLFLFSMLYMSVIYMSFPVESMLAMDIDLFRHIFIGTNAVIGYYAVYTLNINKPPRL